MSRGGSLKNAEILDEFDSTLVAARVSDLHEAFSVPNVEGMLTTLGGYNSNHLLRSLDFERCLMQEGPYEVGPADYWSDDQENREFVPNSGYQVLNEGEAEGTLLGGNLGTLLLLCGTPYTPDLAGSLLLLECDEETRPEHLDRELQSAGPPAGLRGGTGCRVREVPEGPVVAGASFGHTTPQFTFPIGGRGRMSAVGGRVRLTIDEH